MALLLHLCTFGDLIRSSRDLFNYSLAPIAHPKYTKTTIKYSHLLFCLHRLLRLPFQRLTISFICPFQPLFEIGFFVKVTWSTQFTFALEYCITTSFHREQKELQIQRPNSLLFFCYFPPPFHCGHFSFSFHSLSRSLSLVYLHSGKLKTRTKSGFVVGKKGNRSRSSETLVFSRRTEARH